MRIGQLVESRQERNSFEAGGDLAAELDVRQIVGHPARLQYPVDHLRDRCVDQVDRDGILRAVGGLDEIEPLDCVLDRLGALLLDLGAAFIVAGDQGLQLLVLAQRRIADAARQQEGDRQRHQRSSPAKPAAAPNHGAKPIQPPTGRHTRLPPANNRRGI